MRFLVWFRSRDLSPIGADGDASPRVWGIVRSVTLPLVVGVTLRVLWVVVGTRSPAAGGSAARLLEAARQLGHGALPSVDGRATGAVAFGHAALVAPFVRFADATGMVGATFAVSLLNVVFGILLVGTGAVVARDWLGPGAVSPAAWILALWPAQIFLSAAIDASVPATALTLLTVALVGRGCRSGSIDRTIPGTAIGIAMGLVGVVAASASIVVLAPLLAARGLGASWRRAASSMALVIVGVGVVWGAVAARTAIQVGAPTPWSTELASIVCESHGSGALATRRPDPTFGSRCVEDPRRREWFSETVRRAAGDAVTNPLVEVPLALRKVGYTLADERAVLVRASSGREPDLASARVADVLQEVADAWQAVVLVLAGLALTLVRSARRAVPLWGLAAVGITLHAVVVGGPASHGPLMGLLAVVAASFVGTLVLDPEADSS